VLRGPAHIVERHRFHPISALAGANSISPANPRQNGINSKQ
jgi:hypothetical protein